MSKNKIIIGIHGLGNKPPKEILSSWWKASILEGLKKNNYSAKDFEFEMVYWADVLNKEPLNPDEPNNKNSRYVFEKYLPEENLIKEESLGLKQKAAGYLEKYYGKFLVNEIISLKHPTLTDLFIHFNLKELKVYFSSLNLRYNGDERLAREVIMTRFAETLRRNRGKKILLIAHSMGSIIAHDVLLELDPEISIETLITIGSPLGQQYIVSNYKQETEKKSKDKFIIPENIKKSWYNLSDMNDLVAIHHFLGELYKENGKKIKVIDQLVHNSSVKSGNRNPHLSYGYLRTHEVADIINTFLVHKKFHLFNWLKEKFTT